MKQRSTLAYAVAFTALFLSLSLQAATTTITNDPELRLEYTMNYSTPVVRMSFDGNDGDKGFLQVLNKDGVVMRQVEEVELINSPYYFTLDVSELPAGTYTFSLKTASKTYTSAVTIK